MKVKTFGISLLLLVSGAWFFPGADALAQSNPPVTKKTRVIRVTILVDDKGVQRPLAGQLSKVGFGSTRSVLVAEVNAAGSPSPLFECESSDKIFAQVENPFAYPLEKGKPCEATMEFRFSLVRVVNAAHFENAALLAKEGDFGSAQAVFSELAYKAALKNDSEIARFAGEKAIANAAKAMGDRNLDKFVLRDPSQGYQLVFSEEGQSNLKKFQAQGKIPQSGMLDFQTQQLLKGPGRQQAVIK
jgi:hypothetical protein